jgi:anti-sigma factor RsiW
MSTSSWDDAEIHAYVDGALDANTSARLEAQARGDAVLAARIARQRDLRARLRAEFDPVLEEPIPQQLRDALAGPASGAVVTPIGAARKDRVSALRAWSLREWSAIAATLVLGALLGPLVFRSPGNLPIEIDGGRLVAAAYLDTALSTQLASEARDTAPARIGLTFRAAGGEYCRTFALQTGTIGLACRRDGRWAVELLDGAAAQPAAPDGFRQASSALSPALLGALTARGAGDPLTTDQERQRIASGWDARGP